MGNKVSFQRLKNAYHQAAQIVFKYGDKYLPIFERLEKEYNERKKKRDTLHRAIEVAENQES